MKKIAFAICFLIIAFPNNAFAVSGIGCTCPSYKQYCCNPATNCCAASAADCADECGGIVPITCPSECPSTTSWSSTTNNREARCVSGTNYCEYRCKAGYYNKGSVSSLNCVSCPSYAQCLAGSGINDGETSPICAKGYYGGTSYTIGQGTSYTCARCPRSRDSSTSGSTVYGTTFSTGADSITECYLISGGEYEDDSGSYVLTGNCYYKSNTTVNP